MKFKELLDAYCGCSVKPFLNNGLLGTFEDDCFYIDDKKVLKEKYGEYKVVSFDIEGPEVYGNIFLFVVIAIAVLIEVYISCFKD